MSQATPTQSKFAGAVHASTEKEISMSTTSTNGTSNAVETPMPNLRETKRAAAAAKKAPAKKAAPKPAAKKAPAKAEKDGKLFVFEAQGRAGITNQRTFDREMAVAADVKDPSHPSKRWQQGVITRFFVSEAAAQRYVDAQRASGADVILVAAKLVESKEA